MTHRTIQAGGFEFLVREEGPDDGQPVLALHGFPETSLSWASVARRLVDEGRRFVAFDQRGYSAGARPSAVEDYAQPRLVEDVVAVLDALDLDQVHLLGHDWGGAIAWAVASAHADRLTGLTVASTPHPVPFSRALRDDPEQQEASRYMDFFRSDGAEEALLADDAKLLRGAFDGSVPDELVSSYLGTLREPGALTGALNWYRASAEGLVKAGSIEVPTTYVWGARDAALRGGAARATGEFVSAPYRFVELPDHDHWLPETADDVLADAVLNPPS